MFSIKKELPKNFSFVLASIFHVWKTALLSISFLQNMHWWMCTEISKAEFLICKRKYFREIDELGKFYSPPRLGNFCNVHTGNILIMKSWRNGILSFFLFSLCRILNIHRQVCGFLAQCSFDWMKVNIYVVWSEVWYNDTWKFYVLVFWKLYEYAKIFIL